MSVRTVHIIPPGVRIRESAQEGPLRSPGGGGEPVAGVGMGVYMTDPENSVEIRLCGINTESRQIVSEA